MTHIRTYTDICGKPRGDESPFESLSEETPLEGSAEVLFLPCLQGWVDQVALRTQRPPALLPDPDQARDGDDVIRERTHEVREVCSILVVQ